LFGNTFSDNDSLAALISIETRAHLTILLTDVCGVYDRPPSEPDARLIDVFTRKRTFKEGQKSLQGRGGMGAKVDAALKAVEGGVLAAVITSGSDFAAVDRIMRGEIVGTLFLNCLEAAAVTVGDSDMDSVISGSNPPSACTTPALGTTISSISPSTSLSTLNSTGTTTSSIVSPGNAGTTARTTNANANVNSGSSSEEQVHALAASVRAAGRVLQQASGETRTQVLRCIAELLVERRPAILDANAIDVADAEDKYVQFLAHSVNPH
jgi:hypothetical protein